MKRSFIYEDFLNNIPKGFAMEFLQVYSGPPVIAYKFRHWGFMDGPFRGHAATGEMVELFGMAMFEVDEDMKIVKVEFFYDRGELLAVLLKGAKIDGSYSSKEAAAPLSCPVLRNNYNGWRVLPCQLS
ncbi:pathogen-related protein-like [Pistacia vera]|uniref:pathogen-related protein-like n=1 Tax=Pistacia vera TaxID=55513 RepID=UPI001262BC0A|nr:pathogen-related protein-like [Pistacia vera]